MIIPNRLCCVMLTYKSFGFEWRIWDSIIDPPNLQWPQLKVRKLISSSQLCAKRCLDLLPHAGVRSRSLLLLMSTLSSFPLEGAMLGLPTKSAHSQIMSCSLCKVWSLCLIYTELLHYCKLSSDKRHKVTATTL